MYCSNCGTECSDQAQYCMNCSQKLLNTGEKKYEESNPPVQESTFVKLRFPVAGIFLILHGLISLYYAMLQKEWHYAYGGWRTFYVGSAGEFFWLALLQFFIIIITVFLLFWKEKDNMQFILIRKDK